LRAIRFARHDSPQSFDLGGSLPQQHGTAPLALAHVHHGKVIANVI
jgi:hypothetical protein